MLLHQLLKLRATPPHFSFQVLLTTSTATGQYYALNSLPWFPFPFEACHTLALSLDNLYWAVV